MEERKSKRAVDGIAVPTVITELAGLNILEVEVGTNGLQGGDSGHGGRTYLRIKDLGSTDMSCRLQGRSCGDTGQVEIMLGGDSELESFIEALEFAAAKLREQAYGGLH